MKTAYQHLEEAGFDYNVIGYNGEMDRLINCLGEYAEQVANKALEDAAVRAAGYTYPWIIEERILSTKIKLP